MIKQNKLTPLAAAIGVTLVTSIAALPLASAADNPFAMKDLTSGYKVAKDGSCGEGKCGGDKKKAKDGSCGEGKCGGDKKKAKDGSCGEGKCGGDKKKGKDGSCGEGKCGGDKKKAE